MFKFLLVSILLTLTLSAKTIQFSEEKYHEALDTSFTKKGKITFLENSLEILYEAEKSKLIYSEDLLIIKSKEESKEINLKDKPQINMFFTLIRGIYFEDKELLSNFFNLTNDDKVYTLTPKPITSNYIDKVLYKKTKEKLDFLEIYFSSKDRTRIEELN